MQSQYFITALKSVQSLTKIEDHVKNYRPKLIIFCGDPSHRPSLGKKIKFFEQKKLIDFAQWARKFKKVQAKKNP